MSGTVKTGVPVAQWTAIATAPKAFRTEDGDLWILENVNWSFRAPTRWQRTKLRWAAFAERVRDAWAVLLGRKVVADDSWEMDEYPEDGE